MRAGWAERRLAIHAGYIRVEALRSAAQPIDNSFLTRRVVLRGAAAGALAAPFLHRAATAETAPTGRLVLAWHTNIAARWLDPQQHDGTASPDNFLMAVHDAVIKNFREVKYDHPALAEKFDFAEDAASAVLRLRNGSKFHDGTPVTPADVKWSYEHYRGAWGDVLKAKTDGVEIVGADTVRFHFKEPFPDFPILLGTAKCVRCRLGGSGKILRAVRIRRVRAQAHRGRSV